jgi:hypothetical protein
MAKSAKAQISNSTSDDLGFDDMYGSHWLSPDDVRKPFYSSIDEQEKQTFNGQGGQAAKDKIVLTLRGLRKKAVLNKTNALNLAEAWGKNPRAWIGKPVLVKVEMTQYAGKPTKGIRIYPHDPSDMGGDGIPTL